MTAAHEKWGAGSSVGNETAYNLAFDTPLPFFDDLATDKARTDEFARYMQGVRSSDANSLRHLVDGLKLDDAKQDGLLVDVSSVFLLRPPRLLQHRQRSEQQLIYPRC